MKKVLFGAGAFALEALKVIGKSEIDFILDNSVEKKGKVIDGIPICLYSEMKNKLENCEIVISVSEKYEKDIAEQLEFDGIKNYSFFREIKANLTKERVLHQFDGVACYKKAIEWIINNSLNEECIICNTDKKKGYPEVTGYYIPTLIQWGYRELAQSYANWLITIQKEDGSWTDTDDNDPYVFDTAQILKGLLSVREIYSGDIKTLDSAIIRGCDWILDRMTEEGRLVTPSTLCWGTDEHTCSELIHLYCLSPLKEAGIFYKKQCYIDAVEKIFEYYKVNYYEKLMNFSLLSHFYAYVMEALLDLNHEEMCRKAMENIAQIQKKSGAVPAYYNVDWVCSTGLFQLSLVWFRLGEVEKGNRAFEYACKLQNETGGWYGSYLSEDNSREENSYFPSSEISWANKYFLDALYYKMKAEFEIESDSFLSEISENDGRYQYVNNVFENAGGKRKVLDLGCGKGRYIKKLASCFPDNMYCAVDISTTVMSFWNIANVEKKCGTCTNIPYKDNTFDIVYICEALEHAVDVESAIGEMARVTKPGGHIIVVDKNKNCLGKIYISSWEQWFDVEELKKIMMRVCDDVQVMEGVPYEEDVDDLFCIWDGVVK